MRAEEPAFSCPADSTNPVPAMGLASNSKGRVCSGFAAPQPVLAGTSWQGHLGPGQFCFERAGRRGGGEMCLGQLPALGDLLCCWRWGDYAKKDISWDGPVGRKGILTVGLF